MARRLYVSVQKRWPVTAAGCLDLEINNNYSKPSFAGLSHEGLFSLDVLYCSLSGPLMCPGTNAAPEKVLR